MKTRIVFLAGVAALLASCSSTKFPTKSETYAGVYEEKPLSVLVLPPINKSTKVEAKELFYSSLIVPMSQKGYYVLPPLLTMEILKEESAYDTELFLGHSMKRVGELFGVDAVLFTVIDEWAKTTIASQIRVDVEYILISTKTDAVLFDRKGNVTLNMSSSGGGLIGLAASMIATAATKEIVVGRACSIYTLEDLPTGPYSPSYQKDGATLSGPKEFAKTLTNGY